MKRQINTNMKSRANDRRLNNKELSLKEKQQASLEALKQLRDYCDENHIEYYLAYGTLLGAVRHKGFIPWDDDIDVWIPRPDYERLLSEYNDKTNCFNLITCFSDRKYILPYAKLDNGKTARLNRNGSIDDRGIGIDIFPLDGIPQDVDHASHVFKKQNDRFFKVANRLYTYSVLPADSGLHLLKLLVGKLGMLTGIANLTTRQVAQKMYSEEYAACSTIACVTGIHSGRFIPFDKDWFGTEIMEFEGEYFKCPSEYDAIMTKIYGDYMVIPQEADRQSTHTERFVWR